jgi:WD40 repeat protein
MLSIKTIGLIAGRIRGSAAVGLAFTLCACGGGSGGSVALSAGDVTAPTAVNSPTDLALEKTASIVIRFSEAMNPASLQLSGTLAAESKTAVWSKTAADNDTLTLSPQTGSWTGDSGHSLGVDAKDLAGNALATFKANYAVKLAFDTFQAAAVVIGQADFAGKALNQGVGPGAKTLSAPTASPVVTAEGRLFIGDSSNDRVLAYNSLPTANNASADFVLGQMDLNTVTGITTKKGSHRGAQQTATAGGKLIVVDSASNRVVIYNNMPTSGAAVQSVVVGQTDFMSAGSPCTNSSLSNPQAATVTPDGKLIVADSNNNRVLIWTTIPTADGQAADVVVGQADFDHCVGNDENHNGLADDATPSARTLNRATGVWTDGTRLAVADMNNNRVLIWNQMPTTNFQPANVVLGQSIFTLGAFNDDNQAGAPTVMTARTLRAPSGGIGSNGVQLAVTDSGNNRVLIWDTFPTSNFQPADRILGQNAPDHFAANDADQNGMSEANPSANTLNHPSGVLFYRDKLLVTDSANNRVLIFKSK